ncbi:rRNA maturation RNase YbeY [Mycoplasma corogypsi]|uniref:rRNA maturation RNase YbeY n=1 Tax=Mycoplasma corogypsi TaxID=2106 RepID=UPI0038738AF1
MKRTINLGIDNRIKRAIIFDKEMKQIINNLADYFKIDKEEILLDVQIVGPKTIQKLNKQYRNKDYVTDILSFGVGNENMYDQLPVKLLGELVICWEKLEKQVKEFGHSIKREFCYLFAHGLVHLMGYDHEEENERVQMNQIVDDIFNPLQITREE